MVRINFRGKERQASLTIPKAIILNIKDTASTDVEYECEYQGDEGKIVFSPLRKKVRRVSAKKARTPVKKKVKPITQDTALALKEEVPPTPVNEVIDTPEEEPAQEEEAVIIEEQSTPEPEPEPTPVVVIEEPKQTIALGTVARKFPHDISPMLEHEILEAYKAAENKYEFLEATMKGLLSMNYEDVNMVAINAWVNSKVEPPKEKKRGLFRR